MINRRSAGFGFLWGEQRLQPLPLRIGQIASVHTDQYNDLNRVCKHALVRLLSRQGGQEVTERRAPYNDFSVAGGRTGADTGADTRTARRGGVLRMAVPSTGPL
jgi:hypothetical protein